MKKESQIGKKLKPFVQALPDIFQYQIVTKIVIAVWLFLLGRIFQALLKSSGRVAVTSGDWQFLFTTWQGILILLLGLVSLFIYVAFDLNAKVVLCRNLFLGQKASLKSTLDEGFSSIRKFIGLRGFLVVLYIALVAPILGLGLSITATEGLYIPTFITSFIQDSTLYSALAGAAVLLLLVVGIANLFILHGVVIDGLSVKEAGAQSRRFIRANWKDYVKQNVVFILLIVASLAAIVLLCLLLPLKLIALLPAGPVSRALTIFFVTAGAVVSTLAALFGLPVYLLKMTQLFYSYKQGSEADFHEVTRDKPLRWKTAVALLLIALVAIDVIMYNHFDRFFPLGSDVKIIAHRAGGNEGRENTLSGLDTAWHLGAYGSEIDIQRTSDGYYVVNHDSTFQRVAGVDRKPEEMTLQEVKQLSIDGEPVPTFEEMLTASRGRLVLFVELKGNTADRQMADDAVAMIKQYQMEDECVLISLQYDLIDYIETTYPEMQTGFLTFVSFGKTAALNCDYIGLEEESATADAIDAIHAEDKKVLVWTANEKGSQQHFLCTQVDGMITDNVSQAIELRTELERRSDLDRMVDTFRSII
ncbi:MAG: glycerophosphoryl diester phosphodiesterase membrane domain-containing protein [Mogibacterium sp.]|nr:glycerophosphoryl diester phosphodiesterase membrane domain-containing protein [Mogibacterium sp.]